MERAEGWQERLHWSENGPPLAYESSDGKRSEFRYDTVGRLIASRNAEGETVQRCWDSRCRLTALQNENGEQYQFEWAADSLLLAHVGLAGVATRYDYDAAGRTVSRTFAAGHPQSVIHRYYWSRTVQLLARTTPEGQTRYHYTIIRSARRYGTTITPAGCCPRRAHSRVMSSGAGMAQATRWIAIMPRMSCITASPN